MSGSGRLSISQDDFDKLRTSSSVVERVHLAPPLVPHLFPKGYLSEIDNIYSRQVFICLEMHTNEQSRNKWAHLVDIYGTLKNPYTTRIRSSKKFHSNPRKATGFTTVFRYNFVSSVGKGAPDGRN